MPDEGLRLVCEMFGWQGGTIHQVKAEIVRLREVEKAAAELAGALRHDRLCGECATDGCEHCLDCSSKEALEAYDKSKSQDKEGKP